MSGLFFSFLARHLPFLFVFFGRTVWGVLVYDGWVTDRLVLYAAPVEVPAVPPGGVVSAVVSVDGVRQHGIPLARAESCLSFEGCDVGEGRVRFTWRNLTGDYFGSSLVPVRLAVVQ